MKKSILIGLILGLVMISSFAQAQTEQGVLEGKVTVGPICPVEVEGVPCEVTPEVYEERKIVIYTQDKESTIAVVDIDENGNYNVALDPGMYVVDINYIGVDSSEDVPKQIEIKSGETVKLDIDIDTGVRGGTEIPIVTSITTTSTTTTTVPITPKGESITSILILGVVVIIIVIIIFFLRRVL